MAVDPLEVRIARLRGACARLKGIEMRLTAPGQKADRHFEILSSRLNTLLYGIIIAILVPILIRIFP